MARLSPAGIARLKELEGCRLDAYQDERGRWTIGYGDTRNVKPGDRIDLVEAERRLSARLDEFERLVSSCVRRPMTEGQADALIIFAYNVGGGFNGFPGSTLLERFNRGDVTGAALQFGRWIHVSVEAPIGKGDSGKNVRAWQKELVAAGYSVKVDGVFGAGTEEATREWQKANGKQVDGCAIVREKRVSANLVQRRFWEVVRFLT